MITFKKLVLSTLAVATVSAGAVGIASAQEVIIVPAPHCYNVARTFYNPYTGFYYNVWRRVCD